MTEQKLLPCPCCGDEAKEMYTYLTSVEWVACLECGLETKGFSYAQAATKAWNTRVASTEVVRTEGEQPATRCTCPVCWPDHPAHSFRNSRI